MELTKHQRTKWDELLASKGKIVAILGAAGVGKSFSTVKIIEELLKKGFSVAVTGSSHRAVANLKELGLDINVEPKTIHSFTGMVMKYQGTTAKLIRKQSHQQEGADYLFIDELSMLTSQLTARIDNLLDDELIGQQVILIGDTVQLMLEEGDTLLGVETFELTEQLRQVPDESFVKNFRILRDLIEGKPKQEKFLYNDRFKLVKTHKEFIDEYCADKSEKLILCYENNTVKLYNKHIQQDVFGLDHYNAKDIIQPTEPIMTADGRMIVYNRELVTVQKVNTKRKLSVPKEVQDGTIEVMIKDNPVLVITGKTKIKNYLQTLADAKEWKEMYRLKEAMAEFHHTYASSVHSAQGLSVETAYVDLADLKKIKSRSLNQFYRAMYVACSRARNKVIVYDGDTKNYDLFKKHKKDKQ